jgi:hypothetical protein
MNRRRVTWDRHPVLWEIIAKVSWQALEMIHAQVVLAVNELQGKEPLKPCTWRLQH